MSKVQFQRVPSWQRMTSYSSTVRRWGASTGIWGAGAGIGALLFLSVTPRIKEDVLSKIPVFGSYWRDNLPASDKPF